MTFYDWLIDASKNIPAFLIGFGVAAYNARKANQLALKNIGIQHNFEMEKMEFERLAQELKVRREALFQLIGDFLIIKQINADNIRLADGRKLGWEGKDYQTAVQLEMENQKELRQHCKSALDHALLADAGLGDALLKRTNLIIEEVLKRNADHQEVNTQISYFVANCKEMVTVLLFQPPNLPSTETGEKKR